MLQSIATSRRAFKLWLKALVLRARAQYVRAFRSYDASELAAALRGLGIEPGDSVMLHSAFSRLHGFRGSVEQLIDVFDGAVATQGHLLMVPEVKVIKLEMSVPDAIKYIISLGAILPGYTPLSQDSKSLLGRVPLSPGVGVQ